MESEPHIRTPLRILLPLGASTALALTGDASLYTVLPTHTEEAGILLAGVGVILGINRGIRIISNSLAGAAYDRFSRRRLYVPSLFLGSISTVLYALTTGLWPLLLARMLWGIAWSGIWVGGMSVVMDVTTSRNRGRWLGFYQTWFFLGIAQGSFLGGLLTDLAGYTIAMYAGAALTALGAFGALLFLPETRRPSRREDTSWWAGPAGAASNPARPARPRVVRSGGSGLWVGSLLLGVNRFVLAGILSATISLLVADSIGAIGGFAGTSTITGVVIAGRTLLSMASAPLIGGLSDVLSNRRIIILSLLATGCAGMLLIALGRPAFILGGITVAAFAFGGLPVMARSVTGADAPVGSAAPSAGNPRTGRRIGLLHTVGDVGSAAGPPFAYLILSWTGLSGLFLLASAFFAAVFLLLVRPRAATD